MNAMVQIADTDKYARAVKASKAVHWEIDADVIKAASICQKNICPTGCLSYRK
jgi:hypothetical protein